MVLDAQLKTDQREWSNSGKGLKTTVPKKQSFKKSDDKTSNQLAETIAVTLQNIKNIAASDGADAGQSTGGDGAKDTEDTRKPADLAPIDEQCEL